jgi:hypothetical protein
VGVVFTFENYKKTALVVEKNTRVLHSTKKNPTGGASGVGCRWQGQLFCACVKKMYEV